MQEQMFQAEADVDEDDLPEDDGDDEDEEDAIADPEETPVTPPAEVEQEVDEPAALLPPEEVEAGEAGKTDDFVVVQPPSAHSRTSPVKVLRSKVIVAGRK